MRGSNEFGLERAQFVDEPPDTLQRLGIATTAGVAIAYGLQRRSVGGTMLALGAMPLAYRGLTGHWPFELSLRECVSQPDARAALAGDRGIHVRESVRVEKPVNEVYRFWRRLENLPLFMTYLESVIEKSNGVSRWVAKGPGGSRVEWDAEIINEVENKVIAWRSLPGSDVATAGSVNFDTVRGGRATQVSVHLQYAPPAGRLGSLIAALFGREPSQTIREDLRHVKQLLEAGELTRSDELMRSLEPL